MMMHVVHDVAIEMRHCCAIWSSMITAMTMTTMVEHVSQPKSIAVDVDDDSILMTAVVLESATSSARAI